MASLYAEQGKSVRQTFFLMSLFLVFVIGTGWLASYYFQSPSILYIVTLIAILINVFAYWNSDKIAVRLTRARAITREEHFAYWNMVENLCISIGAPMPKLYVISDPSPNAFATGRSPKHSAIVVTTGLLEVMDKAELEGVLAHELAHIQNRDTLLMTSVVVLFGFVVMLLDVLLHFTAFGGGDDDEGGSPLMLIIVVVAYLVMPLLLTIIRLAVSRKREFLADATAGVYTRHPEGLASALEKIGGIHQPMRHSSSATAHLFISDPFASYANSPNDAHMHRRGGRRQLGGRFARLFATHPPIPERVQALRGKQ
ncbi:MAG: M48 family metallopeptidase [Candidatus Kaiserbacteria bacterium]|nr:M48 family metallopeptidase [Candidatus Kaiserbacteria bacterium]